MRPSRLRAPLSFSFSLLFALLSASRADAQATQIKPRFLIVVDSSGSMNDAAPPNSCGYTATKMGAARCAIKNILNSFGDAEFGFMQFAQTNEATTSCAGGSCGQTAASSELLQGISGTNTATLLTYVDNAGDPEFCGDGYTPLGGTLAGAYAYFTGASSPTDTDAAVACRPYSVILLTDGVECCNSCASGGCPNAITESTARTMLAPSNPDYLPSAISCQVACITFGGCAASGHSETAPERAYELYNTANVPLPGPGTALKRIKTYPIGFGIAAGDARIENIAKAGHTNAPGANFGFYADDETALSAALNQIILESIKVEVCNGTDDDCDARIDEGSAKYCDLDGLRTTNEYAAGLVQPNLSVFPCPGGDCGPIPGTPGNTTCDAPEWATSCTAACDVSTANGATTGVCTAGTATHANLLCVSPGERCDQSDDDCDGVVDEQAPPIVATDGCDLIDTDCDGLVDEDCTNVCPVLNCNAGPNLCPESCNGVDDDCDGAVDDGIGSIPCGINLNECTSGLQICQGGVFGNVNPMTGMFQAGYCLGGVGPTTEICDNKDNDCDGVVDQIVRPCSPYGTTLECRAGEESCVGGVWQSTGRNEAGTQVQPANPSLCVGALGPSSEVCDGKNNDCDANTDESPVGMVIPGVGLVCHAPLPPGAIVPGSSTVQVSGGVSRCSPGVTVCSAAAISCSDPYEGIPETCNGLDDNCNGLIDEGTLANVGDDCFPGMPGPVPMVFGTCELGELACIGGALVCTDYVLPSPEICDGRDNDCDNTVDDTIPGVGVTCGNGTGECDPGQTVCHVVSTAGGCMVDASCASGQVCNASVCQTWDIECNDPSEASSEICDGRDNNCNGATDEGVPGVGTACGSGTGQCSPGQQECVLDSGGNPADPADWSIVCVNPDEASRETCDGVDNDCDGETDECAGDRLSPEYVACDSGTINGIPYGDPHGLGADGGGECGSDVSPCMPGLYKCVPDTDDLLNTDYDNPGLVCHGRVDGMDEVCNGLDDNCNHLIDEGVTDPWVGMECAEDPNGDPVVIPACREPTDATEPCGRCKFGQYGCVMGMQVCSGALGSETYESCNGTDDDCDGVTDECVDPTGDNCGDTDEIDPNTPVGEECAAGECESGINVCMGGQLVCEGSESGGDEVCNNEDDDCDGSVDEGFNKGAPCTESGEPAVGECKPGTLVCDLDDGDTECVGEKTGSEEVCNLLDDDCDKKVDEGTAVGEECGTDEGLCEPGTLVCVKGRTVCDGQVGPGPEVCDCADNDCDGEIDEGTGDNPVCGGGAECIMCQCALPCVQQEEFDRMCPQGKSAVDGDDGECFCVGELCKPLECQTETLKDGDEVVQCAPDSDEVGACLCKNNECTFRCKGVQCSEGLACDPTDGKCKQATCLLSQFGCDDGERCGMEDDAWTCVKDECSDVTCAAAEACRGGDCVGSCGKVTCPAGEKCVDGGCVTDECAGVVCQTNEVCDPEDGDCVIAGACRASGCSDGEVCDPVGGDCDEDPCLDTVCPYGERCDSADGQCEARCFGGLVYCGDACVDPMASREHCGAADDCMGANAGVVCEEGLVCNLGECSDSCQEGRVNCDGECIDPKTDQQHCGAKDECDGADRGTLCKSGFFCEEGKCAMIVGTGAGGSGGGAGNGGPGGAADGARVIASGGGGCACSVPGASQPAQSSGTRGGSALVLMALLVLGLGRRRALQAAWLVRRVAPLAAALLAITAGSGCKVDTFCLDCPIPGQPGAGNDQDSGMFGNPDSGMGFAGTGASGTGGSGSSGTGGAGGTSGDGGPEQPDGGCVEGAPELCNSLDDDCDGEVDEDATLTGVDVDTDVQNCGGCGNVCALPHAFNECVDGDCRIDRGEGDNGCDIGFIDLDGEAMTGCEYQCTKIADDDSACNLLDDDCDGNADEDVDTQTDPLNCDGCSFACPHPNADDGAVCEDGECSLDASKCNTDADDDDDPDFADIDGQSANGCEYPCPDDVNGPEQCDFVDNDCDGDVDDGVNPDPGDDSTDPDVGDECGNTPTGDPDEGECTAGHVVCDTGVEICQGFEGPSAEVCDGEDNDCDGMADGNDIPELGLPCYPDNPAAPTRWDATPPEGTQCRSGLLQIPAGGCSGGETPLECIGWMGPTAEVCDGLDNDCDGDADEPVAGVKPGAGIACTSGGGSTISFVKPAQWVDGVTLCQMGETECIGGTIVCSNEVPPEPQELCDGIDQDCDGQITDGFAMTGTLPGGHAYSDTAGQGVDGDGDRVNTGGAATCGTDTGECAQGEVVCDLVTGDVVCRGGFSCPGAPGYVAGATPPPGGCAEVCDGNDNDCDGQNDDGTQDSRIATNNCHLVASSPGGVLDTYAAGALDTGICDSGDTVCQGGGIVCVGFVGPQPEKCDNIDQDCDNVFKEGSYPTDVRIGVACDRDGFTLGTCTSSSQVCNEAGTDPVIACGTAAEVGPSTELCDGLDNDCDGQNDDGSGTTWIGDACRTNADGSINFINPTAPPGICTLGVMQCSGGYQQCTGEVPPAIEDCDTTVLNAPYNAAFDEDCDNVVDDDFLLANNVKRCGTCSNDCTDDIPNANMQCVSGACSKVSCKAGYYDDTTTGAADCNIVSCTVMGSDPQTCCDFSGSEICDAEDNDCDGEVDEDVVLPVASQFCQPRLGRCTLSAVACVTHETGDVTAACDMGDTCVTEPVCTIRPQQETCNAPYNAETCTGACDVSGPADAALPYDEDCDGISDGLEFGLSDACNFSGPGGVGVCATAGQQACNIATSGTPVTNVDEICANASGNPVTATTPSPSVNEEGAAGRCNNLDDDCDGDTDEACSLAGSDADCVTDAWVAIPGSTSFVYPYEASHPGADANTSAATAATCTLTADCASKGGGVCVDGTCVRRACAISGVRSWSNLTWLEAEAACKQTHPDGRLCTEEEWQAACERTTTTQICAWSFSANCSTYSSNTTTCNGLDYAAGGDDLQATGVTGSAGGNTCSVAKTGGTVFDMSGNLKEYADDGLDGTIPVRGGANNNAGDGLRCNFDFTVWPDKTDAKFSNAGFRCCRGAPCEIYSTTTPQTSGGTTTSNIVVPAGAPTNISEVTVFVKGQHNDVDNIDLSLSKVGGTSVSLAALSGCSSLDQGYGVTFTDLAAALPTISGSCPFLTSGVNVKPAAAMSAFDGQTGVATWRLTATETNNDGDEVNEITEWSIRICGTTP